MTTRLTTLLLFTLTTVSVYGSDPNSMDGRRRSKLLTEATASLEVSQNEATISAVSRWDTFTNSLRSFIKRDPTPLEIERQQQQGVDLLLDIHGVEAVPLLTSIATENAKYPASVKWKARETLVKLLPYMNKDKDAVVATLKRASTTYKENSKLANGQYGDNAQEEIRRFDSLIEKAEVAQHDSTSSTSKPSMIGANFREAFKGAANVPMSVPAEVLHTLFENPLKLPTRAGYGLVSSLADGITNVHKNIAGIATAGAYGNAGRRLGESSVNTALAVTSIVKIGSGIKTNIDAKTAARVAAEQAAEKEAALRIAINKGEISGFSSIQEAIGTINEFNRLDGSCTYSLGDSWHHAKWPTLRESPKTPGQFELSIDTRLYHEFSYYSDSVFRRAERMKPMKTAGGAWVVFSEFFENQMGLQNQIFKVFKDEATANTFAQNHRFIEYRNGKLVSEIAAPVSSEAPGVTE